MGWIKRSFLLLKAFVAVIGTRFFTHRPFLFSHLVTSRCNCQCPICLWRGYSEDELSTEQCLSIYEDARRNGLAALILWGGEPLIREDIAQIIHAAHRMGFVILLITNGYRLTELARDICPNLEALIVSIDFPSEKHDEFRGHPGLFRKAVDGIQIAKRVNPDMKLSINCVVTRPNRDETESMISLASKLGVSVAFESMNTHIPFSASDVSSFKLSMENESEIFNLIRHYKLHGYRISNSLAYLDTFIGGKKRYECHSLEASLCMQSNGDVRICLRQEPLANLTEIPIGEVLRAEEYRKYQILSHRCCICNDYGTIEFSHLWNFEPKALLGTVFTFFSR